MPPPLSMEAEERGLRSTPTRVGKTLARSSPAVPPAVHPHACGENEDGVLAAGAVDLSPGRPEADRKAEGGRRPVSVAGGRAGRGAGSDPGAADVHVGVRAEHVHDGPVCGDPGRFQFLLDRGQFADGDAAAG